MMFRNICVVYIQFQSLDLRKGFDIYLNKKNMLKHFLLNHNSSRCLFVIIFFYSCAIYAFAFIFRRICSSQSQL